jgi:hypothetical protein
MGITSCVCVWGGHHVHFTRVRWWTKGRSVGGPRVGVLVDQGSECVRGGGVMGCVKRTVVKPMGTSLEDSASSLSALASEMPLISSSCFLVAYATWHPQQV